MNLSSRERAILAVAQHRANLSVSALAKLSGARTHTVRKTLARIVEQKIASPVAVIQANLLGYTAFDISLSISVSSKSARERFENYIIKLPMVAYFFELGGEYEYSIKLWTKTSSELFLFFDNLSNLFGNILRSRTVSIDLRYYSFGRKYLSSKFVAPIVEMNVEPKTYAIDSLDHNILRLMAIPPLRPASEIGRELGVPASTIEYHIKKLEKLGVIVAYVYRMNTLILGYQQYRLLLSCRSFSSSASERVVAFCARHTNIFNVALMAGGWDYEIGVETANNKELRELTRSLNDYLGDIVLKIVTLPIYAGLKINGYPFKE